MLLPAAGRNPEFGSSLGSKQDSGRHLAAGTGLQAPHFLGCSSLTQKQNAKREPVSEAELGCCATEDVQLQAAKTCLPWQDAKQGVFRFSARPVAPIRKLFHPGEDFCDSLEGSQRLHTEGQTQDRTSVQLVEALPLRFHASQSVGERLHRAVEVQMHRRDHLMANASLENGFGYSIRGNCHSLRARPTYPAVPVLEKTWLPTD